MKRPHQKFDLVEVWWEDASDAEPGWVKDIDTDEPALALSVGFLVKQTKERISRKTSTPRAIITEEGRSHEGWFGK
jgi:hypothetical protein